jgi:predicted ArsR family transcriptional regulator
MEYNFSQTEYNLLRMYRDTIQRAFDKYKDENIEYIAVKLGISCKSLYRFLDQFEMRNLVDENKEYRRKIKKGQMA